MTKAGRNIFWTQLLSPLDDLSPEAARVILRIKFSKTQVARIDRLIAKSREDALNASERLKLESYLQFGNLLTLMHSKARMALRNQHGSARQRSA